MGKRTDPVSDTTTADPNDLIDTDPNLPVVIEHEPRPMEMDDVQPITTANDIAPIHDVAPVDDNAWIEQLPPVTEQEHIETDEVSQAKAAIEETRAEMSDTIEAIKEKLNPRLLVNEAKQSVREATVDKAHELMDKAKVATQDVRTKAKVIGTTVVASAKRNPMPFAIAGFVVGTLIIAMKIRADRRDRSIC